MQAVWPKREYAEVIWGVIVAEQFFKDQHRGRRSKTVRGH